MTNLSAQEMGRIAALMEVLPDYDATDGVGFGTLTLYDVNGEPLGVITFGEVTVFVPGDSEVE